MITTSIQSDFVTSELNMEDIKLIPAKDNPCHVEPNSGEAQFVDFHKVKLVHSPTAKWLSTIDSSLPSKPSPELTCFLSKCDVITDITSRANIILEAIFTIFGLENPRGEWVKKRKNEALTLYYRVLAAICTTEAQTLSNLTFLLTSERFHRSMLTCSAELVLSAHNTSTMLFIPIVLERTGITGFDLCKVIESFVRYEKCLPKKLRHYLNSLEERLLESVVWEKGSSLYNSLSVAKPTLSGEIQRLWLFAEPMPLLDSIAPSSKENDSSPDRGKRKRLCTEYRGVLVERNSFTTPIKHRMTPRNNLKTKLPQPALQFELGSESSPTRPRIGEEACAEVEIDVFFGKVLKVAAVRIKGMVERLKLTEKMRESIYCLFKLTLFQGTSLFFNRHLDHIILCCFYMVAKMAQRNLTFRELIVIYRKQQQYRHDVYRRVFVDRSADRYSGKTGHEHVGVDAFYNEIFLHAIKPLLRELPPGKIEDSLLQVLIQSIGSPNMSPFSSLPDHSPKKMSAKHNVYVSPLRSPKIEAFISNSSNSSYALVGESTHPFQSPSKDLKIINDRLNGNRKRKVKLNFDDRDHGILISDSTVANCLFS